MRLRVSNAPSTFLALLLIICGGWIAVPDDAMAEARLYFADSANDKFLWHELGGAGTTEVFSQPNMTPRDVAVDWAGGMIYWADSDARGIRRRSLDASGQTENIINGLGRPTSLALDMSENRIYWSDWEDNHIYRADLANPANTIEELYTQPAAFGIDLDIANRMIYWVDAADGAVRSGSFDGGTINHLVTSPEAIFDRPLDIVIHIASDRIYWLDQDRGVINFTNLAGTAAVVEAVSGLTTSLGIELDPDGTTLYWSELLAPGQGVIRSAAVASLPIGASSNGTDVLTGQGTLRGLTTLRTPTLIDDIQEYGTTGSPISPFAGTVVTIEGLVTTTRGTFDEASHYIQGQTGGIRVIDPLASLYGEGDWVEVSGSIASSNGEVEMVASTGSWNLISVAETVTPMSLMLNELVDYDGSGTRTAEDYELVGSLVTVRGVVSWINGYPPGNPAQGNDGGFHLVGPGEAARVFLDKDTGINIALFPEGTPVEITGQVGNQHGVMQLLPRYQSDLRELFCAPIIFVNKYATGANDGTSWEDAYTSLSYGWLCSQAIEVWVAQGTYFPTSGTSRATSFRPRSGVAVYGGFAGGETHRDQRDPSVNLTVLSGDIGVSGVIDDNSYHVVTANNTGPGTLLDGFTITQGYADLAGDQHDEGGGLLVKAGAEVSVRSVTFLDNTAANFGGGIAATDGVVDVERVKFLGNTALRGGGMYEVRSARVMRNLVFSGNQGPMSGGGLYSDSELNLTNASFSNNDMGNSLGGALAVYGSGSSLTNVVEWNSGAIPIFSPNPGSSISHSLVFGALYPGMADGGGNILGGNNPLFVDANGDDDLIGTEDDNLRLQFESPAINNGDDAAVIGVPTDIDGSPRIVGSHVDMGAYETACPPLTYVDADATGFETGATWANAYTSLQSALLSTCGGGSEIWVAEGTYLPTDGTDRTVYFVPPANTEIYGGFVGTETLRVDRNPAANVTVLSGDIGTPGSLTDNSHHVIHLPPASTNVVLDGVTVTGGLADGGISDFDTRGGGGIKLEQGSSLLLKFARLEENWGSLGGAVENHGDLTLQDTIVKNNDASSGGGILNEGSLLVTNSVIVQNEAGTGGGIASLSPGSVSLVNSKLLGNEAPGGAGGLYLTGTAVFANTLVVGNVAGFEGGGIRIAGNGALTLTNSTISGNSADLGGGISVGSGVDQPVLIRNSIVWGNTASVLWSELLCGGANDIQILHSTIDLANPNAVGGGTPTDLGGNINLDPLFVDPDGADGISGTEDDNYDLLIGSPAINAGDDTVPGLPATDINGGPRIVGTHVDMGPYENPCDGETRYVDATATGLNNGSSWANAYTDLQDAIRPNPCGVAEIWVADGTYKPTAGTDRGISFDLSSAMEIYGGFDGTESSREERDWLTHRAVLSGDIGIPSDSSDNSYHVVQVITDAVDVVLDGFDVVDGNADGGGLGATHRGGGLYILDRAIAQVSNSRFFGNYGKDGGAIYHGGRHCRFTNLTIRSNSARRGGGCFATGPCDFRNALVVGNTASNRGGGLALEVVYFEPAILPVHIVNSVIWGNSAEVSGGGLAAFPFIVIFQTGMSDTVELSNSIVGANTAPSASNVFFGQLGYPSSFRIDHCLIDLSAIEGSPITDAGDNSNLDPLFIDPDGADNIFGTEDDNFHVSSISPAVDAGDNSAIAGVATDLDGNPRIVGISVDIGVYEVDGVTAIGDPVSQNLPSVTALTGVHPNPFNPRVTIAFDLDRDREVRVTVYDIRGRHIRTLVDERRPRGRHDIVWNGKDDHGQTIASGVYFMRVESEGWVDGRKVTLVK